MLPKHKELNSSHGICALSLGGYVVNRPFDFFQEEPTRARCICAGWAFSLSICESRLSVGLSEDEILDSLGEKVAI